MIHVSMCKKWLKKHFAGKRLKTAFKFSAIVGVTYWATTLYKPAFEQGLWYSAIPAFLLVALVLLVCGGGLLDAMQRD